MNNDPEIFGFIGWCNDHAENHDKIWGYFYRPTEGHNDPNIPRWRQPQRNICTFWARRGKAMQFKSGAEDSNIHKLVRSKMNKGYDKISATKLLEIWPTFIQECEEKLMWDVLAGKVK
jgi:hypothetical protein